MNSFGRLSQSLKTSLLIVGAVFALAGGATSTAEAQEVQVTGPLAGAPAARHMRQYRVNRFNLGPTLGYTLQDEFSRTLFLGLEANFNFLEWLGIGVWGAFGAAQIDTDLTTQITAGGQANDRNRLSLPTRENFNRQVGRVQWGLAIHLTFTPLRGKLSLFQSVFIDTDLYVIAGLGLFGVEERRSTLVGDGGEQIDPERARLVCASAASANCADTQLARASRVALAPVVGLGLNLYANSWFGVALEWRMFPFSWNPSGMDEGGLSETGATGGGPFPDGIIDGNDARTTFNHMVNLGLIFNLPPDPSLSE